MNYASAVVTRIPGMSMPRATLSPVLSPPLLSLFVDVGLAVTEAEADVLKIPCAADEAGVSMTKKSDDEEEEKEEAGEKDDDDDDDDDDNEELLALIVGYILKRLLDGGAKKVWSVG